MNFLIKNQDLYGLKAFLQARNTPLKILKEGVTYSSIVIDDNVKTTLGENINDISLFKR